MLKCPFGFNAKSNKRTSSKVILFEKNGIKSNESIKKNCKICVFPWNLRASKKHCFFFKYWFCDEIKLIFDFSSLTTGFWHFCLAANWYKQNMLKILGKMIRNLQTIPLFSLFFFDEFENEVYFIAKSIFLKMVFLRCPQMPEKIENFRIVKKKSIKSARV